MNNYKELIRNSSLNNEKDNLANFYKRNAHRINADDGLGSSFTYFHRFIRVLPNETETLSFLLDNGADVNSTICDYELDTPLCLVTTYQQAKLLLERGADPYHKNRQGATPLHYAVSNRKFEAVRAFRDFGVNPSTKNDEGRDAYTLVRHISYVLEGTFVVPEDLEGYLIRHELPSMNTKKSIH